MPEIGTSGSMSEDGKRSVGHRPPSHRSHLPSLADAWFSVVASIELTGRRRACLLVAYQISSQSK